ncbi:MAG: hypothetical protein WAL75_27185 [Terracidiphilus sp.]
MKISSNRAAAGVALVAALWAQAAVPFAQSEPDCAAVIRLVDAAVQKRVKHVLGFTDIEHYAVFRGKDETHPAAEMTVKVTYKKGVGKSYEVISKSGSEIVQHFGLRPLLDNEKIVNLPGNVEHSWFNSANYEMKLKTASEQRLDGRDCYVLDVKAKRKASNMIDGELWVDAKDGSIAKLDGIASKSPSPFAGTTHMMRQYVEIDGYPMATHAQAESNSALFGRTVVVIDYSQYHLELAPAK